MSNPNITGPIQTQLDATEQDAEEVVRIRLLDGSFIELAFVARDTITQTFSLQEVKVNINVGIGQLDTQFFNALLVGSTCDIIYRFRPTSDAINLFSGEINGASLGDEGVSIEVSGFESLLDEELPRRTYTRTCGYQHYSEWCTVDRTSFEVSGTIGTVGAMQFQSSAVVGVTENWLQLGVTWIPGFPDGLTYSVKSNKGNVVKLMRPLRPSPNIGSTFEVFAGCDKTFETCKNKFSNEVNFGGSRFVPRPESITGLR